MSAEYPEAEKWKAAADKRQVIDEFLEWLTGEGIELCTFGPSEPGARDERYEPVMDTTDNLFKRWLGIDAQKLEAERRAMLDAVRDA